MARRSHARSLVGWVLPAVVTLSLVVSGCSGSDPGAAGPSPAPPSSTTDPEPSSTPAPSPSPTTSTSTEPSIPGMSSYPTVATLDRQMARRGLKRVPPSSWNAAEFRVASFNLLGASHTRGKDARKGYSVAELRLPAQLRALERARVSVAGLQEFQYPQVRQFQRLTQGRYDIYPGETLGLALADNTIIWRTDVWTVVRKQTTRVPYFGGRMVRMPQVLLRHRASGRLVWFGNFHNPANVAGDATGWRAEAVAIEARLARRLGRHGNPVVMTGDMNAKADFACPFVEQSAMHSADGARSHDGQCLLPAEVDIDWILGSRAVRFSSYVNDKRPKRLRLSDHPLVTATATLLGVEQRPECRAGLTRTGAVWYCR